MDLLNQPLKLFHQLIGRVRGFCKAQEGGKKSKSVEKKPPVSFYFFYNFARSQFGYCIGSQTDIYAVTWL